MLKPRRYTDGVDRAVIRVDIPVSRQDVVNVLAASLLEGTAPDPTVAVLMMTVRKGLLIYGLRGSEGAGDLYGLPDERWDWARCQADRLWPNMED